MREDGDKLRVICEPSDLTAVREALEGAGSRSSRPADATEPKSTVELKGHDAERLLKLLDALDDQDDVDEVFANFDIPEDVLEKLAPEGRSSDANRRRQSGHVQEASDPLPRITTSCR